MDNFGELILNASLKNYNTYRIDTTTKYLIKPTSKEKLLDLVKYINKQNIPYYILGKGSNVILPDSPFSGVIISLENLNKVDINDNEVEAECGIVLSILANKCINNNLQGFEYLANIPGTLGGALYGNAGVKESTIYDYLTSVEVIDNLTFKTLNKKDIDIAYRYTSFKKSKAILVSAKFKLNKQDKEELLSIVKNNRLKRQESQPLADPNAGSVFKNPPGFSAGKLIDDCNLKGYSVGDAQISLKHANFIINKGHATSQDIKKLIKIVQEKVLEKFNINLELEQIIIDWE